jgi:small subunit ribosomal protein S1
LEVEEVEELKESQETQEAPPTDDVDSMEDLASEELDIEEPERGQLRDAIVLDVRKEGLVVDIGGKRDGFVPQSDLDDLTEEEREKFTTIDREVPVVVTDVQGSDGNVECSIAQALEQQDWEEAKRLKKTKEVHETEVVDSNRGGLLVNLGHLQGFVPMSQLIGFSRIRNPEKRYQRLREMVGDTILLKVIEVNPEHGRLIFSQRAASKEWRARRREQLLEELEPGQIRSGRISQITDFGLFVNLGGIDGLVHVSELSWGRIEDPEEVYKVGQRLKVEVLNVDRERQRIGLSLKALQADPWESVGEKYVVGDLVEGTVSQVVDFGIFVELEPGIEGLLHNSELISPSQRDELKSGDKILVKVIRIEPHRRRIGLSVKQVRLHEWETWHAEHEEASAELAPSIADEGEERETEPEAEPVEEEAEPFDADVTDTSDEDAESSVDEEEISEEEISEEEESSETEAGEA